MVYTVLLRPIVKKSIERLPHETRRRIRDALLALRENPLPLGSIKLHNEEGCFYRIRVGSYRVIYEVAHEIRIVTIIRVGPRKDVYRLF